MIINESGSGTGLNLKVVGGTAAPANPAENTVWVSTDTEITSYAFSATQPENPTEGMVWFETGASSNASINVDKKNTVVVYPLTCHQYINGVRLGRTAMTYTGAKWVNWTFHLYYYGDECVGLSGGWQARAWKGESDWEAIAPTLTKNSDRMTFTWKSSGSGKIGSGAVEILKDVDFTLFSTVKVTLSGNTTSGAQLYMYCGDRTKSAARPNSFAGLDVLGPNANISNQKYSLDITKVNQIASFYFVTRDAYGGVSTIDVHEVELLR